MSSSRARPLREPTHDAWPKVSGVTVGLSCGIFFGLLILCSVVLEWNSLLRSVSLAVGIVGLSTALTGCAYYSTARVAPAATVPVLALVYLLKITLMAWALVSVDAPEWLHRLGFASAVVTAILASWVVLIVVGRRSSPSSNGVDRGANAHTDYDRERNSPHTPTRHHHTGLPARNGAEGRDIYDT